jgi:hypothetical protein
MWGNYCRCWYRTDLVCLLVRDLAPLFTRDTTISPAITLALNSIFGVFLGFWRLESRQESISLDTTPCLDPLVCTKLTIFPGLECTSKRSSICRGSTRFPKFQATTLTVTPGNPFERGCEVIAVKEMTAKMTGTGSVLVLSMYGRGRERAGFWWLISIKIRYVRALPCLALLPLSLAYS